MIFLLVKDFTVTSGFINKKAIFYAFTAGPAYCSNICNLDLTRN